MDLNLLSRFLQELILDYDRISLPSLGSFVVESVPAYFSEDGNTIFPPNKRISFKRSESWNDMLIVKCCQKEMNVSEDEAKVAVEAFMAEFAAELKQKKNIEIPSFGKLRSTKEGNYFFVADRKIGIFAEDMGLGPISLKILNENPDQILDISEEVSSIVGGENVSSMDDVAVDVEDIPMVEPLILEEEDPVIMERRKRIIIVLSVIIAILVLIIVFLLFKESILGLFEGMMYSEEEMEILRQNGLM